jgi:DNA-binding NarL/FixJ family response regulator
MISILVVDDHPIVREGLIAVLEDQPDFQVVGSAGTAEEALASALRPDVILLDLELPAMSGQDAISAFAQHLPAARILIFTAYDTEERILGAIRSGASGYLLKGATAEEIARAIRSIHRGDSYLEPRVAAKVMAQLGAPRGTHSALSHREREVLRLVAAGESNKQVAHSLAITERTVKFHISSIFNKLGAENRAQAVALAAQRGLL